MTIPLIQKLLLDTAILISEKKYFQASELLEWTVVSLLIQSNRSPTTTTSTYLNNNDARTRITTTTTVTERKRSGSFLFVPISEEAGITSPDWNDDFFTIPFALVKRQDQPCPLLLNNNNNNDDDKKDFDDILPDCAAACYFNLGLCCYMEATNNRTLEFSSALRTAILFFERAWLILTKPCSIAALQSNGSMLLLMAICTNLSRCCYELGDLDASNQWLKQLRTMLTLHCFPQDHNIQSLDEVHNFFYLTSQTKTGYVAAGAA